MFNFIEIEHPIGKTASSKYSSLELMAFTDGFAYAKPGNISFQKYDLIPYESSSRSVVI